MQNQVPRTPGSMRVPFDQASNLNRVEHQFLTRMPDINSVENDLMKMLNDFSNSRLKKYGNNDIHEKFFKKMDAVRDKQEKIARVHFEQDSRLTEAKIDGEDHKAQSMRDLKELTRQLEELDSSIHDIQDFNQI